MMRNLNLTKKEKEVTDKKNTEFILRIKVLTLMRAWT